MTAEGPGPRGERRQRRFRVARRTAYLIAVLLALTALGAFGTRWRASTIITRLLRNFAVGQVAQQSGGAYRLEIGTIRFTWALRRFSIDSALLTTDSSVNARRAAPLTDLRILMRRCTVGGVSLARLVLSKGVHATRLGCGTVAVQAHVPRRTRVRVLSNEMVDTVPTPREPGGFLVMQRRLVMPSFAPRVRIRRVSFPHLSLVIARPGLRGGESRLELERLAWSVSDLAIDPRDTVAASRPLFSREIEVIGENLHLHPDTGSLVRMGRLRASLTDSTVELREVSWEPTQNDADFARAGPWRRDPLRVRVIRLAGDGLDFGALATGLGIRARRIRFDSMEIELYSDKRLPKNPVRRTHRTPQGWMAGLQAQISVDSLLFRDTRFTYRERRPGHERPALLTFTDVQATATNVRHLPGRRTAEPVSAAMSGPDVLTLQTTSVFEGAARLELTFKVPLDASSFGMTFSGTMGGMPATAVNPLIEATQPVRITSGVLDGLSLRGAVRVGVAVGFVTPRYHDLTLSVTGQGRSGLVRSGGFIGGAVRGIATMSVNNKIRRNNPARDGEPPGSGRINHVFSPTETLPAFLWKSTRGGLQDVVLK